MAITSRPYAGEADYARIRALLIDTYALGGPAVYCTIGDLDWWRYTDEDPESIRSARLWVEDAGAVVGVAWPKGDQVDALVHPRHRTIEDAMFAWAEGRRAAEAGAGERTTLTAQVFLHDRERTAVLRRRGYARGERFYRYRERDLMGTLPEPVLPPGYRLRQVAGEADIEPRVAVHRDAFAPSRMTAGKHRAVMGSPTYRPDLDLVAVAPDGAFAAFCIVWFDAANRIGVFEPVGCNSAHRRRGLGRAIMAEGLRRLQGLGARRAYVTSAGGAPEANGLYEAAGFRLVDDDYAWTKAL